MKAEETLVANLFESKQQVRVPIWQRRYSWDRSDWQDLWVDIARARDEGRTHFLGSFVFMTHPVSGIPSEARRFDVVDGQQRTITLFLLVAALRDAIAELQPTPEARNASFHEFTSQLLTNSNLREGHKERLVLQDNDDSELVTLISSQSPLAPDTSSRVAKGYRFFRSVVANDPIELLEQTLATILTKLEAVWVTLDSSDNAHRVFQTLNAGGKPLRQSDLVRNYFFLLLGSHGEAFYRESWKKMEDQVSTRSTEAYFSAWTISQGHTGANSSIFSFFQKDLAPKEDSPADVLRYGQDLVGAAQLYSWIREPEACPITAAKRRLIDLKNWGSEPAEGLVLHLLRRHQEGALGGEALSECIECILSFMARRMLAGYEPNLHRSIFVGVARKLRAASSLTDSDVATYLRSILSSGRDVRTWPSNEAVKHYTSQNPVYLKSRQHWVFGVLERLNSSFFQYAKHMPDPLDRAKYQVEHVLPQKLTEGWENDLSSWGSPNAVETHQTVAHVLGNLTLTAINPQLSQKQFAVKKTMLQDDWLKLNGEIAAVPDWSEDRINTRSSELAARACGTYREPYTEAEIEEKMNELDYEGSVPREDLEVDVPDEVGIESEEAEDIDQ